MVTEVPLVVVIVVLPSPPPLQLLLLPLPLMPLLRLRLRRPEVTLIDYTDVNIQLVTSSSSSSSSVLITTPNHPLSCFTAAPHVVFPPLFFLLFLLALSSSPFHCALEVGFGQT